MSEIITQAKANEEIRMYLKNFKNASTAIATIENSQSKNYYNGDEISFVFERNIIEALWKLNPSADGLRVYYGSHEDGTPTLVLIACSTTRDEANNVVGTKNLIYSAQIGGGEWPRGYGISSPGKGDCEFDIGNDDF